MYLGGFEVGKEGIAVIELRVGILGSNGGSSFDVEHGSDTAQVTNAHEAEARETGDMVREREKSIKIAPRLRIGA